MNIKEELTCQHCNQIYNHPIQLNCCGESICKQHIEDLISDKSSNKFVCPFCVEVNTNQNFKAIKSIENFIQRKLHEFKLNPKFETTMNNLKKEIANLEKILKDPENYIFEEISELKRQVDLDREELKSQIDDLADDLIKQLDANEKRFKAEYKADIDFSLYDDLVNEFKSHSNEFEKCLKLLSVENEKREEKCTESEKLIETIQPKIKELKESLFSMVSIKYEKAETNIENIFGKLIIQVSVFKYFFLIA